MTVPDCLNIKDGHCCLDRLKPPYCDKCMVAIVLKTASADPGKIPHEILRMAVKVIGTTSGKMYTDQQADHILEHETPDSIRTILVMAAMISNESKPIADRAKAVNN